MTADPEPQPGRPRIPRAWRGIARGFGSVAAVIVAVALILAARYGLGSARSGGGPPVAVGLLAPLPAPAALPGLQTTPAPWPAEYGHLGARMSALGLPDLSDTVFHIHAMLRIYVDGRPVTVPAEIGLPASGAFFSPLHTHDTSGIVHIESTRPYGFRLGQFFDVWGVAFTTTQLGGYRAAAGRTLAVYVNGRRVADGPDYAMRAHDTIIVGYGRPGSFPTVKPGDFSGGL